MREPQTGSGLSLRTLLIAGAAGAAAAFIIPLLWRPGDVDFDPLAPPPPEDFAALPATTTRRTVSSARGFRLTPRQWKLGLATGALAFVLAVAFVTASELLAGDQVGGPGNPTTFFSDDGRQPAAGDDGDEQQEASSEATREAGASPTVTPGTAEPEPIAAPAPARATPVPTATPTPAAAPAPPGAEPTASPAPVP